jgi:XapX domain-containing protein
MKEVLFSFFTGFIAGFVFSLLKLPIPAPPNISGLMGIFGIFVGYFAYHFIFKK